MQHKYTDKIAEILKLVKILVILFEDKSLDKSQNIGNFISIF